MKNRSSYPLLTILLTSLILLTGTARASASSYREEPARHYQYQIKGAVVVRPDKALFPLTISVQGKNYVQALAKANQVQQEIKKRLNKFDEKVYRLSPVNFYRQSVRGKRYTSISFFSKGRHNGPSASMLVNLVVRFTDRHSFQDRADMIARAYDFLNEVNGVYAEKKNMSVRTGSVQYGIDNVEKFRAMVVKQIYQRGKLMVDIVAKQEHAAAYIRKVHFSQDIQQNMHHFNKATLSIDAKIEFGIRHGKKSLK